MRARPPVRLKWTGELDAASRSSSKNRGSQAREGPATPAPAGVAGAAKLWGCAGTGQGRRFAFRGERGASGIGSGRSGALGPGIRERGGQKDQPRDNRPVHERGPFPGALRSRAATAAAGAGACPGLRLGRRSHRAHFATRGRFDQPPRIFPRSHFAVPPGGRVVAGSGRVDTVYRGRLAPSPTGYLHLGHARTFWAAPGARPGAERGFGAAQRGSGPVAMQARFCGGDGRGPALVRV